MSVWKSELFILFVSVRPPKKSWKNISNLSGGEKTLSSLALVRAHFTNTKSHFKDDFIICTAKYGKTPVLETDILCMSRHSMDVRNVRLIASQVPYCLFHSHYLVTDLANHSSGTIYENHLDYQSNVNSACTRIKILTKFKFLFLGINVIFFFVVQRAILVKD